MPARDRHHQTVIRALEKEGWTVIRSNHPVRLGNKRVWIDLRAEKPLSTQAVFIEVKEFSQASVVEALRDALGQYMLYRIALDDTGVTDVPLFLAIPDQAYRELFATITGKIVIEQVKMNLVVFDPTVEEIVQWIPYVTPSDMP